MESFLKKYSNVLTLSMLIVVQMLGLAFQVKRTTEGGGSSNLLHIWAVHLITPLEKVFVHSERGVANVWHNYVYLRGLRSENADLKNQLEELRILRIRQQEDALQARRIQALLGFKEQFIHKTVAAQVIGTSGSELSRVIYIDKGTEDGVKADMAVITPDGIVGKVLRAQSSTAQVLEITDQTSGVGALLVKNRLQGIVKGTPGGDVVLNNIMSDEKVEVGDQITTSGGDRIFPKGLPIGTVSAVYPGKDVFLNVRLKPAANLRKLEEVLVVTQVATQAPDTQDLGPIRASDILAARLPSVPQTTTDPNAKPAEGQNAQQGSAPQPSNPTAQPPKTQTGVNPNTAAPKTGAAAAQPAPAAPKSDAQKKDAQKKAAAPAEKKSPTQVPPQ